MVDRTVFLLIMNQMDWRFNTFYRRWCMSMAVIQLLCLVILIRGNLIQNHWILFTALMFIFFFWNIPHFFRNKNRFGFANSITMVRIILILLTCYYKNALGTLSLFIGFSLAVLLDGLDGLIARKFRETSEVGEKFDMEVDSFLVLTLSWIHFEEDRLSGFILIPGAFKYINEILFFWIPNSGQEFLSKKIRSTIAVLFFISLLLPFIFEHEVIKWLVYSSGGLVILSFLSSTAGSIIMKRS